MPKKLKVSSNQRVDLVDFNRASSEYTADSDSFHRKNLWLSKYSSVLNGFRIEIADQATNPGEFTIFNGISIDKTGALLNNEDQIDDSRTVTLTGTGAKFYIEIEFVESESDVDVRAFWDPTFAGNDPLGREFTQNVSTRLSPDWKVSTPISTTEFSSTSDVNSSAVPIAILYTNNFNEIVGFTPVNAATVLEKDAESADTMLYVLDSTLLPASGTVTVGGTSVSIVDNDRANGILTISAPLGVAKKIGDIVVETGSTAAFLPESSEAVPGDPGATSSGDQRRVFFKGDENRGSAFSVNPEDAASRSDSQIKSLKDYVDFLSAQIRELKFGAARVGETSFPAVSVDPSSRYYDYAGNISSARAFSFTVGDSVLSNGDYNSTSNDLGTVLQAAHDALDLSNGGSILVKEGNYVWDATVVVNRPFTLEFANGVVFAGAPASSPISIASGQKVEIRGMPAVPAAALPFPITTANVNGIELIASNSHLQIDFTAATNVSSSKIDLSNCTLTATPTGNCFQTVEFGGGALIFESLSFKNCLFKYEHASDLTSLSMIDAQLANATFTDCKFDLAASSGSANSFISSTNTSGNVVFERCKFIETNTGKAKNAVELRKLSSVPTSISFISCEFEATWNATTDAGNERTFVFVNDPTSIGINLVVDSCIFRNFEVQDSSGAGTGKAVYFSSSNGKCKVSNCDFSGVITSFDEAITIDLCDYFSISNNSFSNFYRSIFATSGSGTISGNHISNTALSNTITYTAGISSAAATPFSHIISNNSISQESSGSVSAAYAPVAIECTSAGKSPTISNNEIYGSISKGEFIGIQLEATAAGTDTAIVSGNRIVVESSSANAEDIYGMISSGGNIFEQLTVEGNHISILMGSSATNVLYGINLNSNHSLISNNNIRLQSGTSGNVEGIKAVSGWYTVCSNAITLDGKTGGFSASYGINIDGKEFAITGNNVECSNVVNAIRGIISEVGNNRGSISNNYIRVATGVHGAIFLSASNDFSRNIEVCGNNIWFQTGTSTRIIEVFLTGAAIGGVSVDNNTITEQVGLADRIAIWVRSSAGIAEAAQAVSVSNNSITSVFPVIRTTGGGAIVVTADVDREIWFARVSGNIVRFWNGSGNLNRTNIRIFNVDGVVCNSNLLSYSGFAGEAGIFISNTPASGVAGNCSANHLDGSSVSAGGLTTTGSNS